MHKKKSHQGWIQTSNSTSAEFCYKIYSNYVPISFLIYISCHGTFHGHCSDITELFIDWWTHDQSQQSNLRQTFVVIILRVVLLNLDMFLLTNMVLSKGSLKMPRATISRYFHFILLIRLFFGSADLKRVERSRTAELKDF